MSKSTHAYIVSRRWEFIQLKLNQLKKTNHWTSVRGSLQTRLLCNHNPRNWRTRCKYITRSCFHTIDLVALYFYRPVDFTVSDSHKLLHNLINTKIISQRLKENYRLAYISPNQFYDDMSFFWKKIGHVVGKTHPIYLAVRWGKITFLREWHRLFNEVQPYHKQLTYYTPIWGKRNNLYRYKKFFLGRWKLFKTTHEGDPRFRENRKMQSIKSAIRGTSNSTERRYRKKFSTSHTLSEGELTSLIAALGKVEQVMTNKYFTRMIEIIKEAGKLEYNEDQQMEVDFAELDSVSIRKLQALVKELKESHRQQSSS